MYLPLTKDHIISCNKVRRSCTTKSLPKCAYIHLLHRLREFDGRAVALEVGDVQLMALRVAVQDGRGRSRRGLVGLDKSYVARLDWLFAEVAVARVTAPNSVLCVPSCAMECACTGHMVCVCVCMHVCVCLYYFAR